MIYLFLLWVEDLQQDTRWWQLNKNIFYQVQGIWTCTNVTFDYDSSKTVGEKIVGVIFVLQSQNLNFPRRQKNK